MINYLYLLRNTANDEICNNLISNNLMELDFEDRHQRVYSNDNMMVIVEKGFTAIATLGQTNGVAIKQIKDIKCGRLLKNE